MRKIYVDNPNKTNLLCDFHFIIYIAMWKFILLIFHHVDL